MPIEMYRCNCNRSVELRPDGYCTSCWSKVGNPFYPYEGDGLPSAHLWSGTREQERLTEAFMKQGARPASVVFLLMGLTWALLDVFQQ